MRTDLWLLALLVGCSGGDDGTDTGSPSSTDAVLDLVAAPLVSMPTVIEVTWRTEQPSTGHVAFGLDGATDRVTPEQASGTDHRVLLVGLPQDAAVTLRVEGDGFESDPLDVSTGTLPGDVPALTVTGGGNDRFTTVAVMEETRARVVLLDPEGRVTWMHEDTRGLSVFRARVAHDGDGIVYLSSILDGGPAPDSKVIRVGWDGVEHDIVEVADLAHDFVELEDGTVVALAYETRDAVLGNQLIEISPDGTSRSIWSAWDCFDPAVAVSDDPAHGWTHTNALDYDAASDAFLVGMRNLNGITSVDRATGSCDWTFGGIAGDVAITGERFAHQHQFERTADGLLVFDNDGAPGTVSRVIEYAFDEGAGTASVVRTIRADPPLFSFILGDVHRVEDDQTMVVWSAAGTMDRYDAAGSRTWRVQTPPQILLGFAQWLSDPYRVE